MATKTRNIGTCQCCFNQQVTKAKGLVLHGYNRPGHGYIEGQCPGAHHTPYEVSCEFTGQLRDSFAAQAEGLLATMGKLQQGEIDTIYVTYTVRRETKLHTVRRDDASTWLMPDHQFYQPKLAWADHVAAQVKRLAGSRAQALAAVEFFARKVKEWVATEVKTEVAPPTGPLIHFRPAAVVRDNGSSFQAATACTWRAPMGRHLAKTTVEAEVTCTKCLKALAAKK